MQGVLAVFSAQGIRRFVKLSDLFRLHRVLKEGVLDRGVGDEVEEDDARGPVEFPPVVELIEKLLEDGGELQRIHGGACQLHFHPCGIEIVFLQDWDDLSGRERVATRLDAGRFQVSEEMGKEVFPVARGRGKGFHLADGGVDALLFGQHGIDRFTPQLSPDLYAGFCEALLHGLFRESGEFEGRFDPHLVQIAGRGVTDAPYFFHREILEIPGNQSSGDDGESVRLLVLGGNLGEDLGKAQSRRYGDTEFPFDLFFDPCRDCLIRGMEKPAHARDVRECFVDGVLFHLGGEAPYDGKHPPGKKAVRFIVGGQDNELRAEGLCLMERDAAFDAHSFGGIAGAGHNPPLSSCDDGLPTQFRVNGLLTGCEEGIAVDMDNGLWP